MTFHAWNSDTLTPHTHGILSLCITGPLGCIPVHGYCSLWHFSLFSSFPTWLTLCTYVTMTPYPVCLPTVYPTYPAPTYSHACMFPPSYFPHSLVLCVFPCIYKTHKSFMFLQFIYQLLLSISYSHLTYSAFKKLGCRPFFSHAIHMAER